jgi:Protein of unknown function (DUF3108)
MNLPAGEITVAVQDPPYTFMATGETAPWMARFFEAHDTFTTRTNDELLPQLHERDQRENARHVRRTFVYDHGGRVIRIGRDPHHAASVEGVSLPLAEHARDALSAVFYARTLPLRDGDRYQIPINEAGRSMVADVAVAGRESIALLGRQLTAIRLNPVIRRRVERRRPVTAVLWLSDDSRRLPLAMDIEAAFGRVRLELINYSTRPGT